MVNLSVQERVNKIIGINNLGSELNVIRYDSNRKLRIEGISYRINAASGRKVVGYLTLDEVGFLIKQGKNLKARSFPSNRDVTQSVLRAILTEQLRQETLRQPVDALTARLRTLTTSN